MTNEEACADAVGVPTPLQSKANKMMKRIALAAALCALAGCAVPIHTQAQALCETRVKRITNFEAAYFEYRLNKGESPREAFAAASKQYPNEAGEFLMSPGAVNAMLTLEHNLYGQPAQVAENPSPNWADCGPTQYLVFGAGGDTGGPVPTAPQTDFGGQFGQPVISSSDCIGAVVNGVCQGTPAPGAPMATCHGQMVAGVCTGPMF